MNNTYDNAGTVTDTHNQFGCPYLDQSGAEAVLDWASVLASIDPANLAPELRSQLQQLRVRSAEVCLQAR